MTKKIALSVILFISLATTDVFAQKKMPAKASKPSAVVDAKPTKLETMDWIAGKMKENLGLGREFVSYSDGKFVYKKEWKAFVFCVSTFDLNKVMGMSEDYLTEFNVSGKGIITSKCDDEAKSSSTYEFVSISGPNYNDYSAPFTFTADAGLVERLKKAFTTLVEYNATKKEPGEKF